MHKFRGMADLEDRWAHVSALLNRLVTSVSYDLPLAAEGGLKAPWMDKIIDLLTDPDPEQSLVYFARSPLPAVRGGYFKEFASPRECWRRMERWSTLWPAEIRKSARRLGVGTGKLPKWKQVETYFDELGFSATPVIGYIDVPVYMYMLSRRRIPFSTSWSLRVKQPLPNIRAPADPLHDVGHALAFANRDYRSLIVEFARAMLKNRKALLAERSVNQYGRFFELSFAHDGLAPAEPIGAIMLTFDPFIRNGVPILKSDPALLRRMNAPGYFESRKAWAEETRRAIARIRNG